jgi:polyisoprenoid-binding protein YceI
MKRDSRRRAGLPLYVALATAALAADSNVKLTNSSIIATFRQQNVPVEAAFRNFSGTIIYDAARPDATSATLSVDMTSLDAGDDDSSAEVRKAAWFDSARYPQAAFHSTAIKPGAPGHFDATGTLTIKGKAQTITVSVAVQNVGHANAFDGAFEISRKAYGIGDASWAGVLDDIVAVRFHLLADP